MVKIERKNDKLVVTSEYNSIFVSAAKKLNGQWKNGAWYFDPRISNEIEDLCFRCFGANSTKSDLVNIRIEFTEECSEYTGPVALNGRTLARATGRDSGARVGDGVAIIEGSIGSGGSMKNWRTMIDAGTVMRVFDFPRIIAEEMVANPSGGMSVTIENPQPEPTIDRAALEAERDALLSRLIEIETLIGPKVEAV